MSEAGTHEKSSKLPNTGTLIYFLMLVASVAAAVIAWTTYVHGLSEAAKRSVFEFDVVKGILIMSGPETAMLPTKLEVAPIFEVPGDRLRDAVGEYGIPYEGLQTEEHVSGVAIRIPNIKMDVCEVEGNRDRCGEFEVSQYQVRYSFGWFADPVVDHASIYLSPD